MQILDCTIRDGGYYTNWDFDDDIIDTYIESINNLPIDYVEIGYRSVKLPGYFGEYFYCPKHVLKIIKSKSNKKIAIMINEKNVNKETILDLVIPISKMVDMVRIAVDPANFNRALGIAKIIKSKGFEVGFNVMYMSTWAQREDFYSKIENVNGIVDFFYMVDSFGSIYPDDLKEIYNVVRSKTDVKIGFHSHNNLELGLINTLVAIDIGVDIVDSTILGMGRGAGNLKTELLLVSLSSKGKLKVDYSHLAEIVSIFNKLNEQYSWGTSLPYMVSGANSFSQKEVMEWVVKRYYSFNNIIGALTHKTNGNKDSVILNDFIPNKKVKKVLIIGGGSSGSIHAKAINMYLRNNPEIVTIYASSKNTSHYCELLNDQIHCFPGNEGVRFEREIKNSLDNTNNVRIAIYPPYPREMGTYIPDFFKNKAYQLKEINFVEEFKNSVTALAIQISLELGAEEISFTGYDGYVGNVSQSELELFSENNFLFLRLKKLGIRIDSLTPTLYEELPQSSVYGEI